MNTSPSEKDLVKDVNAKILSSPDENDSAKLYCSESMGSSNESLQCSESMFSSASDDDLARITLLHQEASKRGFPSSAPDSTGYRQKLSMDAAVQESNGEAFFQSALWEHQYSDPSSFNMADKFADFSGQHYKAGIQDIYDLSAMSSRRGMGRGSSDYGHVTVQPVSSAGLVPYWNRESMVRHHPMSLGSHGSTTDIGCAGTSSLDCLDSLKYQPKSTVPFSMNSNTQLFANSCGSYENINLRQKGTFGCGQNSEFGAVSYDSRDGNRKGNSSHVYCEESSRFGQFHSSSTVIESQNQIPALSTWYCKPIAASPSVDRQTDLEVGFAIPPDLLGSLTTGSADSDFSISDFDQYQKASTVNVDSKMPVNPVSAVASNPHQFQISGQMQDVPTVYSAIGNDTEMSPGRWALRRYLKEMEDVNLKGTADVPGRAGGFMLQDLIKFVGETEVWDSHVIHEIVIKMCRTEPGFDLDDVDAISKKEQTLKLLVEEITKLQKDACPKVGNDPGMTAQSGSGNSCVNALSSLNSPCTSLSCSDSTTTTSLTSSLVRNSSGNSATLPWNTSTAALPNDRKESCSGLSRPWENAKGTDENGNTLDLKSLQSSMNTKNESALYSETADDAEVKTEPFRGITVLGKTVDTLSAPSHNTAKSNRNVSGQTDVVGACDGAPLSKTANTIWDNPADARLHKTADIKLGKTAVVELGETADVLYNKLAKSEPIDVLDRGRPDITAEVPGGMKTFQIENLADVVPQTNLAYLNSGYGAACGVDDKNIIHSQPPHVVPAETADIINTVDIEPSDVIEGKTSDLKRFPPATLPAPGARTSDVKLPESSLLKSCATDNLGKVSQFDSAVGSKLVMESRHGKLVGSGGTLGSDVPCKDTTCLDEADVGEEPFKVEPDFSLSSGEKVELAVSTPSHDKLNEMVTSAGAWMFQSCLEEVDGLGGVRVKGCDEPNNKEAARKEKDFDTGDVASNEDAFPNLIIDTYEDISSSSDSKSDPVHPASNNPRSNVVRQLRLDPGPPKATVNTIQNLEDFISNFSVDEDVGSELYEVSVAEQSSHDLPLAPKNQDQMMTVQSIDATYQENSSAERQRLLLSCREYSFGANLKSQSFCQGDSSVESRLLQRSQLSCQDDLVLQPSWRINSSAKNQKLQVPPNEIETGYAESQTVRSLPAICQESSSVVGDESLKSNPEMPSAEDHAMKKPQLSHRKSNSPRGAKLKKLHASNTKNRSAEHRQSKASHRKRGSANRRKSQPSYCDNSSTRNLKSQPYYPESNSTESLSCLGMSSACIVLSDESEPPVEQTWRTSQTDSQELSNMSANFGTLSQNPVLRKSAPVRPVPIRYSGYTPYPGFEATYNMSAPYHPWWGSYQMNYFAQIEPLDLSLPKRHPRSLTHSVGRAGQSRRKSSVSHSDKVSPCKRRIEQFHSVDGLNDEQSGMTVISSKSIKKTFDDEELSAYYTKEKNYHTSLKPPKKRRYLDGENRDITPVKEVERAKNLQAIVASSPFTSADTESPAASIWKHPKKRKYVEKEDNLNVTNTPSFEVCKLENRFEGEHRKSSLRDDVESTHPQVNVKFKEPAVDLDFSYEEKRWAAMASRFRQGWQDIHMMSEASTPDLKEKKLLLSSVGFGEESQKVSPEGFPLSSGQGYRHMNSPPMKDVKQVHVDGKREGSPFGGQDLSYEESRWLAIQGSSGQGLEKSRCVVGDKFRRKQIVKQEPRGDSLCSGSSRDMFAVHSYMPGTVKSGISNFIVSSQSAVNVRKMDNPVLADSVNKVKYPSWCKGMVSCDSSVLTPYGGGDGSRDIDYSHVPWYRNETGDVIDALLPLLTCGICAQKMKGYFLMALHMMKIHEINFAPQRLAGLCDICGNQYPGVGVLEKHIITGHTGLSAGGAQANKKGNSGGKKKSVHHRRRRKRSGRKVKGSTKIKEGDGNISNMECRDESQELWYHIENDVSGYEMIERSDGKDDELEQKGLSPVHYIESVEGQYHKQVKKEAKSEDDGSQDRMKKEKPSLKGQMKVVKKLVEGAQGHESTWEVVTELVDVVGQGNEVNVPVPGSKKMTQKKVKVKVRETDEDHGCLESQDGAEIEDTIDLGSKKNPKRGKGGPRKKNKYSMREVGPFACEWEGCDMILKTRETLKVHMRRHTGEKPFGCHVCDYKGRQIASLHWHLSHFHGIGDKYQSSIRVKNRTKACTPDESNSTDGRKTKRLGRHLSDDELKECTKVSRKNTGQPTDDDSRQTLAAGLSMKCDEPAAAGVKVKKKGKKSRKVELDPRHPLTMKIIETERPST